jgi:hypothetical protein
MTLAVCCRSHSPLLELTDAGPELIADVETAQQFAAGAGNLKPLNPDRDRTFLDRLAANDLDAIDRYPTSRSRPREGTRLRTSAPGWLPTPLSSQLDLTR